MLEVRHRGRLLTRIKERSDGDVEVLQLAAVAGDRDALASLIPEQDILTCLHALEGRGLLASYLTVYSPSSTEYICEWRVPDSNSTARGDDEKLGKTASGAPAGQLACGDLRLDLDSRFAHVNGRRLTLTYSEFELLRKLLQRPGHVFTRADLALASSARASAVTTRVARLRRKLRGAQKFAIETVAQVGYRAGEPGVGDAPKPDTSLTLRADRHTSALCPQPYHCPI